MLTKLFKNFTAYRAAGLVALVTTLLLAWMNSAVGIIGSENQPANLMYFGVILIGIIGSIIVQLRPRGMARVLFTMTLLQVPIPLIALSIWPELSWGGAGIRGVFVLNTFFAVMFALSAFLFRHTATSRKI